MIEEAEKDMETKVYALQKHETWKFDEGYNFEVKKITLRSQTAKYFCLLFQEFK